MSPTLLSRRLQQLTRAGLLERRQEGGQVDYLLTPAGMELRPVVEAIGVWGMRWIGELGDADLDPKLLLWDMHRHVDHAAVPMRRVVVAFSFPDAAPRERDWWLVLDDGEADVCDADPGHPVDVLVTAPLRRMVGVWMGDVPWSAPCARATCGSRVRPRCAAHCPTGSRCRRSPPSRAPARSWHPFLDPAVLDPQSFPGGAWHVRVIGRVSGERLRTAVLT